MKKSLPVGTLRGNGWTDFDPATQRHPISAFMKSVQVIRFNFIADNTDAAAVPNRRDVLLRKQAGQGKVLC